MEIRTLPMQEIRVQRAADKPMVIEGHAAVFDSWSETLGGLFPFKEKVKRGAFVESLANDDIRALFNHDPNYVLGRNRANTLELYEDDKGLFVRIILPDTQWARDLAVSIERGDITQMSFGFVVEDDEWQSDAMGDLREIRKVKLFDVSAVTYPAYTATDVGVRGMQLYKKYKAEQRAKEDEAVKARAKARDKERLSNLKTKFRNI